MNHSESVEKTKELINSHYSRLDDASLEAFAASAESIRTMFSGGPIHLLIN
jgi:hypothetical protein